MGASIRASLNDGDGRKVIVPCPVPELSVAAISPAVHGVVNREAAGMTFAGGDRGEDQRGRPRSGNLHGRCAIGRRAVAQLAVAVESPAVDSADHRHAAGVDVPPAD